MKQGIDRRLVKRSFHRRAAHYDGKVRVQRRVLERLAGIVLENRKEPSGAILDVGCGTGRLLKKLSLHYPESGLYGVDLAFNMAAKSAHLMGGHPSLLINGDAEALPFRDGVFDMIVSSSVFQWMECLESSLKQCCRVLSKGGALFLAFFGEGTLHELRHSYIEALSRTGADISLAGRAHSFSSVEQVKGIVERLPFREISVFSEMECDYYDDAASLLAAVKGIGAGTAVRGKGFMGLGWRKVIAELARCYEERFGTENGIPASYCVIYVVARDYQGGC